MIKSKKQMFMVIVSFILIMLLTTVTYAFFNYTRTGVANRIQVGRIYFNSEQTTINLTNVFPIASSEVETDTENVGSVTIHITGDTTYSEGIEYLVSAVDVNNTVNNKSIPISVDISYNETENKTIGTRDNDYFINRGGNNSIYRVLARDTIKNDDNLVAGYIAKGSIGIDGTITIKAYLAKDKILISDTYPEGDITHTEGSSEVIDYTNGTSSDGREVFTTSEWNSLQQNGISFKVKVEANEGIWVPLPANAMNELPFSFGNVANNIVEIRFEYMNSDEMHQRYDAAQYKADITYRNEGEVLSWLEENEDDNTKYTEYIVSDGETYFMKGENLFNAPGCKTAKKIIFNNVNTSRLTTMEDMFYDMAALEELDVTSFDTSNVTNISNFVYRSVNIERINMSGLDLRKAVDMKGMFYNDTSLTEINLSGIQVRDVQYMNNMFYNNSSLESINLDGLGSDNLTSMSFMFSSCSNLKTISMKNFNFGSASMQELFYHLEKLETIDLSGIIISNVTNMGRLFNQCSALTTIYVSNDWNLDNVTNTSEMFCDCTSLVGGQGTTFESNHVDYNDYYSATYLDKTYAHIDGGESNPGYFTLKTN